MAENKSTKDSIEDLVNGSDTYDNAISKFSEHLCSTHLVPFCNPEILYIEDLQQDLEKIVKKYVNSMYNCNLSPYEVEICREKYGLDDLEILTSGAPSDDAIKVAIYLGRSEKYRNKIYDILCPYKKDYLNRYVLRKNREEIFDKLNIFMRKIRDTDSFLGP